MKKNIYDHGDGHSDGQSGADTDSQKGILHNATQGWRHNHGWTNGDQQVQPACTKPTGGGAGWKYHLKPMPANREPYI